MCGIVGVVHRDGGPPVSNDVIGRMCDAIRHRGPDDEGRYLNGNVGLGIRRLSIIDLAGGNQPISNEDESKTIVFNGEIYNYRAMRHDLEARGHRFRSAGDTETIVHLYEESGPSCVEHLRGMFAFALWDSTKRSLLLARDRFGIKPLYIVDAPWGIAFASELKALVAVGLTARELDWKALDMYFELGYIPAPHSPFTDVRKLEPGHTLEWKESGEVTVRRYWDLPSHNGSVPQHVEKHVLEWLDESIKAHMVSDVPVAALLSGGLDSSAVVAGMAVAGERAHAFTARYHGSGSADTDETPLATQLANRYGVKHTIVDIEPDVSKVFEPMVRALDEPHADESAMPTWMISQAVASEYKVVLSGAGGDELFAGYRRHLGHLVGTYYNRLPGPLRRAASGAANALPEPRNSALGINRLKRFLRTDDNTVPERFLGYFSRLPTNDRRQLYKAELQSQIVSTSGKHHFSKMYTRGGSPTGLRAALYLDYKTYLPDDILALSDRISMAHSLEVRVPFVDHELVERVFPLPDRLKIGLFRNKHLLRQVLRPRLPRAHFDAPKRGFVGPTASWLRNELREMLTDELSQERIGRLGYFDSRTVHGFLDDHFSRRHNREGILWEMLCFLTWHRAYVEQPMAGSAKP